MIERQEINQYIEKMYHVKAEKRFTKFPSYDVFRRLDNHKWFGLITDVSKNKISLSGDDKINLLNLKLEPELIGILLGKSAYFPAYHMNKEHWISINLDDAQMNIKEISSLIDNSFKLAK
ncbi:MmcQ/YjbR family DNA-binding protein [Apilactobacillus ozensis]|uniref:MmcQ/YjbR family DNA-binding protein n=1 Tax=Apilactobacillus ozensis TaxID=866801 RepID=UPI00200A12E1|nr:MmcQ/YjbR family DNA-binding protein [Apilactobacillus ozensis]MCK8607270.1 MmcQ/YjbR family DNA-binding protein [Apilactobacillus ozensis]